jgi:hypothetical protein
MRRYRTRQKGREEKFPERRGKNGGFSVICLTGYGQNAE